MKNTLAIIGSHPRTRAEFDFNRQDCDIWVFNEALSKQGWASRADAVFQMHAEPIWRNPQNRNDASHGDWLKSGNTPVIYMQAQYDDVPMSRAYPLAEIERALLGNVIIALGENRNHLSYFTSSVAYALALGIYQGYPKIEIYGVEMETDTEYRYQREGVALWIGIAAGRGIDIEFHGSILTAPRYGYEGDVSLDYDVFVQRIAELSPQCEAAIEKYEAAKKNFNQAVINFLATKSGKEQVAALAQEQLKAAEEFGIFDGARQENERYKNKADAMRTETGGEFIFSRQEFESSGQAIYKKRAEALMLANTYAGKCEILLNDAGAAKNHNLLRAKYKAFAEAYNEYMRVSTAIGMYSGALNENATFLKVLDVSIRAAGGAKSEAVLLEALNA